MKIVVLVMLALLLANGLRPPTANAATASTKIKHVVVIMQENHTFDSMFWTYPGVIGGIADNSTYCVPEFPNESISPSNPCNQPIPFNDTVPLGGDLPHSDDAATYGYNNGSMNGFLVDTIDKKFPNGNPSAYSYYDNSTIPIYWALAQHYELADMFFSSVASYSQPNHWYMLAGTAPAVSITEDAQQERQQVLYQIPYSIKSTNGEAAWTIYLNQSQTIQTIVDQLSASQITWKYYDAPIPKTCSTLLYAIASVGKTCLNAGPYDYWNPLEAQNSSFVDYSKHFQWRGQVVNDTLDGTLPNVSFVIPAGAISDHPSANVTLGEYWVSDVVDAIENSPTYRDNTLIVLTWDDFGGFFDTIASPGGIGPQNGLGFRAPTIFISPYVTPGSITNTVFSFESILKFIDDNWGLIPLNQRVASANDLSMALNLGQKPIKNPYTVPITQSDVDLISQCFFSNVDCNVNLNPQGNTMNVASGICYIGCPGNGTAFIDDDED